jgi:hypothetical protein
MPGGISWEQMAKRDLFIEETIKAIDEVNKRLGYKMTSKETLALLVQRYIAKHKPPALPGTISVNKLKLVENNDE